MTKILRPRRGKHEYATSQNIKLAKGEIFFSYTGTTPGENGSTNRIYMGDGNTSFSSLKPFLTDNIFEDENFPGLVSKLPGDTAKYLNNYNEWTVPPDNNTTYDLSLYTLLSTFNDRIGVIHIKYNNWYMANKEQPAIYAHSSFAYNNTTYRASNIPLNYHYGYYNTSGNNKFYCSMNGIELVGYQYLYPTGSIPYIRYSNDTGFRSMIYCSPGKYLGVMYQRYFNATTYDRVCNIALYSSTQSANITKFTIFYDFLTRPQGTYDDKISHLMYIDTSGESVGRYFTIGGRNEGGSWIGFNENITDSSYVAQGNFALTMIKFN